MPFRADRLTEKSQEAIHEAQSLASEAQQQEILPEHLLLALLQQKEGTVPALLQKLSVAPQALIVELTSYLEKQPKVYGAETYIGQRVRKILDAGWCEMERVKDEFMSTVHILLALTWEPCT